MGCKGNAFQSLLSSPAFTSKFKHAEAKLLPFGSIACFLYPYKNKTKTLYRSEAPKI